MLTILKQLNPDTKKKTFANYKENLVMEKIALPRFVEDLWFLFSSRPISLSTSSQMNETTRRALKYTAF